MSQEKYIGMDVHQATISVAVLDSRGKLIMESILETKAATILEFLHGLHGSLSVTFEEGTSAAWLHDLLKPHVTRLVVCDPRKNALLKDGSKSDRIDARKLAELLRGNQLTSVYHGEQGMRTLKELGRSYRGYPGGNSGGRFFILKSEHFTIPSTFSSVCPFASCNTNPALGHVK
jgi:transposase